MKVALVRPPPRRRVERYDYAFYPHLGLAYVAGYLRSKGIACRIIDGKFDPNFSILQAVTSDLSDFDPDIIGITAMTHEIDDVSEVASEIKKALAGRVIVIGGVHATTLPYETLADYPMFDIAVFGEGEYTMYELIEALEKGSELDVIKGIAFRKGDDIHVNLPREPIERLDDLPFPAWDLLKPTRVYPVLCSRGCPYQCIFCARASGRRIRRRSPENIVKEIEWLIQKFGVSTIYFHDETFTIDKRFINRLMDLMIEKGIHKQVRWYANTRVDRVDEEILLKMKDAGCYHMDFGVESGNEEILKNTKKGITLAQAENAVKLAKKVGLRSSTFFILGHPHETKETIWDTIKFAAKLNSTKVSFGIMVPYPGTEVYVMARKGLGGYKLISQNWKDFNKTIGNALELECLSRAQLELLQLIAYLYFYLSNRRVKDLLRMIVAERRVLLTYLKKFLHFPNTVLHGHNKGPAASYVPS